MIQPTPTAPTTKPISTVTKHIKLYSDNPIHDCIDRIIDAVAVIDEDDKHSGLASAELYEVAQQLLMLATDRMVLINLEIMERTSRDNSN
jgi:hypothetical protein